MTFNIAMIICIIQIALGIVLYINGMFMGGLLVNASQIVLLWYIGKKGFSKRNKTKAVTDTV